MQEGLTITEALRRGGMVLWGLSGEENSMEAVVLHMHKALAERERKIKRQTGCEILVSISPALLQHCRVITVLIRRVCRLLEQDAKQER